MLAILLLLYLIYVFMKKQNIRFNLFCITIILSLFFFSSKDPLIGMPLYFYAMCLSICVSFFENKDKIYKMPKKILYPTICIIVLLILQIILMLFGINVSESLLINASNTDVIDIASELHLPVFNFTVFKHFVFYIAYLLFAILNLDLIRSKQNISILLNSIFNVFKILFCGVIIEFLIVNIANGWNDRHLMEFIFSVESNQVANWLNGKVYSVAFWFTEKSEMTIVSIYYLLRLGTRKQSKYFLKWDIASYVALLCADSTTAIIAAILYNVINFVFYLKENYSSMTQKKKIIIGVSVLSGLILFCLCFNLIIEKMLQFINPTQIFGSAYYRRRSIEYGFNSFINSPLLGQGIGTIYCHSGLIQTLGNVGILGLIALICFHKNVFKFKVNRIIVIKSIFYLFLSVGAFMIQTITSPFILVSFIAIIYNFDNMDSIEFKINLDIPKKEKALKFVDLFQKYIYRHVYAVYLIVFCFIYRNKKIVILGGVGIGDVCISMAYFEEFKKITTEPILIIAPKKLKWLLERYNVQNCEIKYLETDMMRHLGCSYNPVNYNFFFERFKKKNLHISDPWAYIDRKMIYYKEISALTINKGVVYKLDSKAQITYAPAIFKETDIRIENKSVLLNPYSNSSNMSIESWKKISEILVLNGYKVYVNSPNNEKLTDDTISLNITLDQMHSIVDKFDIVISIRSGFLDYLIEKCHHVICIYEDQFFYNMYNLEKWEVEKLQVQNYVASEENYLIKLKEGLKKWM